MSRSVDAFPLLLRSHFNFGASGFQWLGLRTAEKARAASTPSDADASATATYERATSTEDGLMLARRVEEAVDVGAAWMW
jgi:hypothetical protein